jgi:transcriptional antiterminator NusG
MADESLNEKVAHWYVVSTYKGGEKKVKEQLLNRTKTLAMEEYILEVETVDHPETRPYTTPRGKQKTKEIIVNDYPGYIFVKMFMTDEAWFVVRNTPNVTGFIGSSGKGIKPTPVPDEEMEPILARIGKTQEQTAYQIGENVRILFGTFRNTEGFIKDINLEAQTTNIEVLFFGSKTILEDIPLKEIERIKSITD